MLRPFLTGAYTDEDSRTWAESRLPDRLSLPDAEAGMQLKEQVQPSVEDVKQFPAVERRRNPAVPYEHREAGEVAVFQELGKALTSSLQLDQVLRTIMEKIDEFLRPDNWSLLLLDEASQDAALGRLELTVCGVSPAGWQRAWRRSVSPRRSI